ncbi:MAG: hypothetical protein E7089_06740 [Bacteroidales bacterium]|nr:hypothetical protein [Bacteroidales bacterium]
MKKLLLLVCLSLSSIYAMAEMKMEQDTTSCYHLEEVSIVSFYRTEARVDNVVNREKLKHTFDINKR